MLTNSATAGLLGVDLPVLFHSDFVCVVGRRHIDISNRFSKCNILFGGKRKEKKQVTRNSKLTLLKMFTFALED